MSRNQYIYNQTHQRYHEVFRFVNLSPKPTCFTADYLACTTESLIFTLPWTIGALASIPSRATNQNTSLPVFVHGSAGQPDLFFSMGATDNGSFAFHTSGPSKHSWIAVGTGTEMQDSMMVVLYSDGTENGE